MEFDRFFFRKSTNRIPGMHVFFHTIIILFLHIIEFKTLIYFQAIFNRQDVVKRKQEEEAAASATAIREVEEKVREANEALRKIQERAQTPQSSLTPLIPKSYLTPPSKPMGNEKPNYLKLF